MLHVKAAVCVGSRQRGSSLGFGLEPVRERLAVLSFRDILIVPHYTFRAMRWVSKGLINSSALQFVWALQSETFHHTNFNALKCILQLVTMMFNVRSQTCLGSPASYRVATSNTPLQEKALLTLMFFTTSKHIRYVTIQNYLIPISSWNIWYQYLIGI